MDTKKSKDGFKRLSRRFVEKLNAMFLYRF